MSKVKAVSSDIERDYDDVRPSRGGGRIRWEAKATRAERKVALLGRLDRAKAGMRRALAEAAGKGAVRQAMGGYVRYNPGSSL